MFPIKNAKQLGTAYALLRYYEARMTIQIQTERELAAQYAEEVKQAIREYIKNYHRLCIQS